MSYFDVGRESLASLLGLYDPAYARFGLGIYTMLEEIEFARARELRFFYPGYVVPGLRSFEYKLELGPVQVLGEDGGWSARAVSAQSAPPESNAICAAFARCSAPSTISGCPASIASTPRSGSDTTKDRARSRAASCAVSSTFAAAVGPMVRCW